MDLGEGGGHAVLESSCLLKYQGDVYIWRKGFGSGSISSASSCFVSLGISIDPQSSNILTLYSLELSFYVIQSANALIYNYYSNREKYTNNLSLRSK